MVQINKKWRENAGSTRASTGARKMAGKSATINFVDHQKQNKWRENSTVRATTEVKEMAGKSATIHMDQLKQKNGGKILRHVRRGEENGGKIRNHLHQRTPRNSGNRGLLAMSCLNCPQVGQEV
jgi:hypothetical protein